MKVYEVELTRKINIARDTTAFFFTKPLDFQFNPGQYLNLSLNNNKHFFSIASAPYEAEIIIETRMRNTVFKNSLKTLPIGSGVEIKGPFGSFMLHNNSNVRAVFLAGGIGITPFRSISYQAAKDNLPHKIYLFYSNRSPKDAPDLEEFKDLEKKNSNFKFIPTMTKVNASEDGEGERGYINKDMLTKYLSDLGKPIYYIAGPPNMVLGLRKMLNQAGVNDDIIRLENFTGY